MKEIFYKNKVEDSVNIREDSVNIRWKIKIEAAISIIRRK
jgi:hypothetical protein